MDLDDEESGGFPPSMVCLTPLASSVSPSPRRLSTCFVQPNEPVRAKRQLAWVSLQGRLVGADEASSATTVDKNGAFSAEAWELFSPIQRVLTVAVVGAAAANSHKNKQILKLQQSVHLRDQVLSSMQKKLDNLCEQMNYFKDQTEVETQSDFITTVDCVSKLCHNNVPPNGSSFNLSTKRLNEDEVFKYKTPNSNEMEPDESRMSDLSDWAPSVTSSDDIQLEGLAVEHDIDSLRKECEEKDATIKELSHYLNSSQILGSKRVAELEEIICRKNMIINKLQKDIVVLEQKVVNLTRLRRPNSSSNLQHCPRMTDNVLYDMESTSDPSSSDSDSPRRNQMQTRAVEEREISAERDLRCHAKSFLTFPLKQKSLNQEHNLVEPWKPKNSTSVGRENRSTRRPPIKSKDVAAHKRWV